MTGKKVLLLVVDACTPGVVDSAIEAGKLPHLARLRSSGFHDGMCSAIFPSITPAATASIVTGRYPAEHGIVGAHWYDAEGREVVYYGDDLSVIRQHGIGRYFERLLVGLNDRQLRADTLFDQVERAGLRAACINHIVFRGLSCHRVHVPLLLRLLPGVPRTATVPGPSSLHLGDFVSSRLPGAGRKPRHAGGPWHRFGLDDRASMDVLLEMVRDGLPSLTVAYFPDYDFRAHDVGPFEAVGALESFDGMLGELFAAAGGFDALLSECCVVLTADHSQSGVRAGDGAGMPLASVLGDLTVADAGRPWQPGDVAKVCVNMRAAEVYFRQPTPDLLERTASKLLSHPDVDQVLWRVRDGAPAYRVATRERGWLSFRIGSDGPATARDEWGQEWSYEGDLSAVAGSVSDDGVLRSSLYPNPFERIRCGVEAREAGHVWVTAVPGVEFTLPETKADRGGGAHGSLHASDSLIPLMAAGLPAGVVLRPPTRTVDVAPLCLEVLGLEPPRPVGAGHAAALGRTPPPTPMPKRPGRD